MTLENLKPAEGSIKKSKRIGRGQGSTRGGTSTRGHKGQKSRSGYSKKIGFEGGQMPIQRRLPKFGFTPIKRNYYKPINLNLISELVEKNNLTKFTYEDAIKFGLVDKKYNIKILAKGDLDKKIEVHAHSFSKKAEEIITKLGGKTIKI